MFPLAIGSAFITAVLLWLQYEQSTDGFGVVSVLDTISNFFGVSLLAYSSPTVPRDLILHPRALGLLLEACQNGGFMLMDCLRQIELDFPALDIAEVRRLRLLALSSENSILKSQLWAFESRFAETQAQLLEWKAIAIVLSAIVLASGTVWLLQMCLTRPSSLTGGKDQGQFINLFQQQIDLDKILQQITLDSICQVITSGFDKMRKSKAPRKVNGLVILRQRRAGTTAYVVKAATSTHRPAKVFQQRHRVAFFKGTRNGAPQKRCIIDDVTVAATPAPRPLVLSEILSVPDSDYAASTDFGASVKHASPGHSRSSSLESLSSIHSEARAMMDSWDAALADVSSDGAELPAHQTLVVVRPSTPVSTLPASPSPSAASSVPAPAPVPAPIERSVAADATPKASMFVPPHLRYRKTDKVVAPSTPSKAAEGPFTPVAPATVRPIISSTSTPVASGFNPNAYRSSSNMGKKPEVTPKRREQRNGTPAPKSAARTPLRTAPGAWGNFAAVIAENSAQADAARAKRAAEAEQAGLGPKITEEFKRTVVDGATGKRTKAGVEHKHIDFSNAPAVPAPASATVPASGSAPGPATGPAPAPGPATTPAQRFLATLPKGRPIEASRWAKQASSGPGGSAPAVNSPKPSLPTPQTAGRQPPSAPATPVKADDSEQKASPTAGNGRRGKRGKRPTAAQKAAKKAASAGTSAGVP